MTHSKTDSTQKTQRKEHSNPIDPFVFATDKEEKSMGNGTEKNDRFFVSVRRNDLSAAKKSYAEESKPAYAPSEANPKGLYSDKHAKVVDDYAVNRDWRSRIQEAISDSAKRTKNQWPQTPGAKRDEDILWEIDDRIKESEKERPKGGKSQSSVFKQETSDRSGRYAAWLSERNAAIKIQEEKLAKSVADKRKQALNAEKHIIWSAQREEKLKRQDAELAKNVADKKKRALNAEKHIVWSAQREEKIKRQDAELAKSVAVKKKNALNAEKYRVWAAQREQRIGYEEKMLTAKVLKILKSNLSEPEPEEEFDEEYDQELQILLGEKKKLEQLRQKKESKENLDKEFVV